MKSTENDGIEEESTQVQKKLSDKEKTQLHLQNNRKVTDHTAWLLEKDAKKYWDLFYKRNENRFFKDRHWTTREFEELLGGTENSPRTLFEIGCGVGNFFFPLVEEKLGFNIIACDLSPRAVEIVRNHNSFNPNNMQVFQCDITTDEVLNYVEPNSVDIATIIFVLSAIHPVKFEPTLSRILKLIKPGGMLLLRDYGLYDMAQLRFKAGHKIGENFYMRQDGTRSYYFTTELVEEILRCAGFDVVVNSYIHRRTINKKENIDVPRVFVQCKAKKPH